MAAGGGGTVLTERAASLIRTYRALEQEHQRDRRDPGHLGETAQDDLAPDAALRWSGRVPAIAVRYRRGDPRRCRQRRGHALALAGGQQVATITHESVETLGLAPGIEAFALIKASSGPAWAARSACRGWPALAGNSVAGPR
ncbi:TOBE domain-containing protein [Cupriavidus basilensis]